MALMRRVTKYVLALVLIVSCVAPARAETGKGLRPIKGMVTAADFILKDLSGKPVRFSEFKGKVVLLNFWTTWCPPCRVEMPAMERLYQAYRDDGLVVVAVSMDRSPADKVKAFVEELGLNFPVLHDRDERVARLYSVPGVPTSYIVDARGRIMYRALGEYDWFGPTAKSTVEDLLRTGHDQGR
jgi:peroxiredoxin